MILRQRTDLISRKADGEALILDRSAGKVHQLNSTASYIWDHCDGARTVEEVVAGLANDFSVDIETARRDVLKTLEVFEHLGLLVAGDGVGT